jgi:hypothetical protein
MPPAKLLSISPSYARKLLNMLRNKRLRHKARSNKQAQHSKAAAAS